MTQNSSNNELMSAMLDGESDADQTGRTIKWLAGDPAARARLGRYCAARDALRGELQTSLSASFADRVRSAVDAEPTLLAPRQAGDGGAAAATASVRPWLRPAAGLAIAASVAVVSFIGLNQFQGERPAAGILAQQQAPATVQSAAAPIVPNGLLQTSVEPASRVGKRATANWNGKPVELRQRLDRYLLDHTEHASMGEMNGVISYSRLVGYDRGQ